MSWHRIWKIYKRSRKYADAGCDEMLIVMRSFILLMLSPPSRICSLAKIIRSFAKVQICLRIVHFPSLHCSPSAFCLPWFMIFQIKKQNYLHSWESCKDKERRKKFAFKDHVLWAPSLRPNLPAYPLPQCREESIITSTLTWRNSGSEGKWLDQRM